MSDEFSDEEKARLYMKEFGSEGIHVKARLRKKIIRKILTEDQWDVANKNYAEMRQAMFRVRWNEHENEVYVSKASRAVYWTGFPCRPSAGKIAQIPEAGRPSYWSENMENFICNGMAYKGGSCDREAAAIYAEWRKDVFRFWNGILHFPRWVSVSRQ